MPKSQPGEAHGRAITTREDVVEMRHEHRAYGATYKALAAVYGISAASVRSICRGVRWRHVPLKEEPPARAARVRR